MRSIFLMVILNLVVAFSIAAQGANSLCPKISVVGPAGLTWPGDVMEFVAEVTGVPPSVRYKWSVEGGSIVDGQGTARIKVSGGVPNSVVKAIVELEGVLSLCQNSGFGEAGIAPKLGCGAPLDDWGNRKPNEVRGRLDNFFNELTGNPDNLGLIVLQAVDSEKRDPENPRIRLAVKHAHLRKFDLGRIIFVFENGQFDETRTKLYRLPPGAEFPCSDCPRINGSDLR